MKKKIINPRSIRWPFFLGDDFDRRLKRVVVRLNKQRAGSLRYTPLSVNRYIVDAVLRAVTRDENRLDSSGGQ